MDKQLKEKLLNLPTTSGVYLMKDITGNIIYVGKAKNLKRRVNQYFTGNNKPIKTANLVENIYDFDFVLTTSELDALMLENNLIKKYQPHFNILLKDGKQFPYIKIKIKEKFPTVEVTRKVKNDGAKYFGPYFAGIRVKQIMEIIARAFNIRTCSLKLNNVNKKQRACLNFNMGLCSAPCINKISSEDYSKKINQVISFLNGNTEEVEKILREKMELASETLNYEKAIEIREEINALKRLKLKFTSQFAKNIDLDVFGYYSNGLNTTVSILIIRSGKMLGCENFNLINFQSFSESISNFILQYYNLNRIIPKNILLVEDIASVNALADVLSEKCGRKINIKVGAKGVNKKLVTIACENSKEYLEKSLGQEKNKEQRTLGAIYRLKEVLKLKSIPYRMECYDISNISGTNSVASMVVFVNGEPAKKLYRKFKIKTVLGANDFASLEETLSRRLDELENGKDISFSVKPNLIVIDGGKGQLSAVSSIFKSKNSDIDLVSIAKQEEILFSSKFIDGVNLKKTDVALQVVQRIRDEAHRFAITFHRNVRDKAMVKSALDDVAGIGKARKIDLFNKFKSIKGIKNATLEELTAIKGITQEIAIEIKKQLNK